MPPTSARDSSREPPVLPDGEPPDGEGDGSTPRSKGWFSMAKEGYEELVKAIIRPPRAPYTPRELGPAEFEYGGKQFVRDDCQVENSRGLKLECSFWHRRELPEGGAPCVVYMHGNASCRAEALQILAPVFASGANVFSFDFAGCGMSPGDYISLGWHEKDDVASILAHLRGTGHVTSIALWGRSMGSVSAVLQASRDASIAGLVLDSPFASLEQVALELVTSAPETVPGAPNVPPFLVKTALTFVARSVKNRANFDLYKLRPVDAAKTCFVPALFGCGDADVLVRPHHSQLIYDAYAGDKNLVRFEGDHNDVRPGFFNDSACIFLKQVLLIPEELALDDVPLDRDSRPLSIVHAFSGMGGGLGGGGLGRQHQAEAQQLVRAQHAAMMREQEDAMLMQAIMASLESSNAAAPPQTASSDETPSSEASAPPPPPTQLSHAPPPEEGDEDALLQQAIRLSLEAAQAGAPPAVAPPASDIG